MRPPVAKAVDAVNVRKLPLDEPVGWVILAVVLVAVPVGPWIVRLGVRQLRTGYRILATDPVGAGEVGYQEGIVEVEGVARPLEEPFTAKYSDEPALAQSWRRERKRERTDDDGNTNTEWRTVSRGTDSVPFLVEDETGSVAVDPSGAQLSITESEVRQGGRVWFGGRDRRHREYEGRIAPGDGVHVYGQKRRATDPADLPGEEAVYVGDGDEVSEFVVSDGSELRTVLRYVGWGLLLTVVGVVWIPISLVVLAAIVEEMFGVPIPFLFVTVL